MAVTLHTDLGDLKLELFCDEVPKATEASLSVCVCVCVCERVFECLCLSRAYT